MRSIIKMRLHELESDLNYTKEMIGFYWRLSDKDKPHTGRHFASLNNYKNAARMIRKELKMIRETLKVLK